MHDPNSFVSEADIDYYAIINRGGANFGDEDFCLFRCPQCDRIYLADYEVDCVYLSPHDLSIRLGGDVFEGFDCAGCGLLFPDASQWCGDNAELEFRVSWDELRTSAWGFAVRQA